MLFQKRRAAREMRERLAEAEAELLDLRRSIAAAYDVFDHAAEDSLVEASRASGATPWQSLRDVVIPLIRPGMIAAFFLIFLPALRELTTSVLLYGPTTRTIGVAIYTLNEDGETVYACALAGVALLLIVGGEILIKRFFEKKKRLDNGGA